MRVFCRQQGRTPARAFHLRGRGLRSSRHADFGKRRSFCQARLNSSQDPMRAARIRIEFEGLSFTFDGLRLPVSQVHGPSFVGLLAGPN